VISVVRTKYGSVVLPYADIITGLTPRGRMFRTDRNDAACKTNSAKVGPDNDGQPGGCDNVRIVLAPNAPPVVQYVQP
jgi:hypothetical protein